MNKKIICFLSFLLMVSFSAGVFVQFLVNDPVSLSTKEISFWQGLCAGCKSDLAITALALLLSLAIYTVPFVLILIVAQVFTLGFSAAYLLASHPQGFPLVCAVLLPRCLFKLPAYMALILLSYETTRSRRSHTLQKQRWQPYIICTAVLMFSSLLEAVLHLLIVSP